MCNKIYLAASLRANSASNTKMHLKSKYRKINYKCKNLIKN